MAKKKTPIQQAHDDAVLRYVPMSLAKDRSTRMRWEDRGLTLSERDRAVDRLVEEGLVELSVTRQGLVWVDLVKKES